MVQWDSWGEQLVNQTPTIGSAYNNADPVDYEGEYGYYGDYEFAQAQASMGSYSQVSRMPYLLTHRYFDPSTGKFVSRDPIGYQGGQNQYGYAGDDPVNAIDPNGTDYGDYLAGIGDALNPVKAAKGIYVLGKYLASGHASLNALGSAALTSLNPVDANATDRQGGARVTGDLLILAGGYGLLTKIGTLGAIGEAAGEIGEATGEAGTEVGTDVAETATTTNCFVAGTPVQMADGTTKPIQEVRPGDEVASRDPETGANEAEPVVAVNTHLAAQTMTLSLSDGERLECTPVHRFYVEGRGFVDAGKLAQGDVLEYGDEGAQGKPLTLTVSGLSLRPEATSLATATRVYNFTVANTHTYFVGTTNHGVWVHNAGGSSIANRIANSHAYTKNL